MKLAAITLNGDSSAVSSDQGMHNSTRSALLKRKSIGMKDEMKKVSASEVTDALSERHDNPVKHGLQLDVAYYQDLFDDPNLTEAEREQFITALWQIIVAFVELGFEVHPTQQVCGKGRTKQDRTSVFEADEVDLDKSQRAYEDEIAPKI